MIFGTRRPLKQGQGGDLARLARLSDADLTAHLERTSYDVSRAVDAWVMHADPDGIREALVSSDRLRDALLELSRRALCD